MNNTEEITAIRRTVDKIIADPELLNRLLIRAGITDEHGNLTDQYRSEPEAPMRLIPPPPLEINEGFEPSKTYVPDQKTAYSEVMELIRESNRFTDQYLELAGLIFDEYKKICDATGYAVSPEMAVVGKFLHDMTKL